MAFSKKPNIGKIIVSRIRINIYEKAMIKSLNFTESAKSVTSLNNSNLELIALKFSLVGSMNSYTKSFPLII